MEIITQKVENLPVYIFNTRAEMGVKAAEDAAKIINEKSIPEMYELADFAFKLIKTNIPLTDIMGVIPSIVRNGTALNMQSQHVPYSDSYVYKYYNGMAIVSYDIDEAARRINAFIYG